MLVYKKEKTKTKDKHKKEKENIFFFSRSTHALGNMPHITKAHASVVKKERKRKTQGKDACTSCKKSLSIMEVKTFFSNQKKEKTEEYY